MSDPKQDGRYWYYYASYALPYLADYVNGKWRIGPYELRSPLFWDYYREEDDK